MTQKEHDDILEEDVQSVPLKSERKHSNSANISITMTPAKIFGGGFAVGVLLMAIPLTFLVATRSSAGIAANTGGTDNLGAEDTLPPRPTEPLDTPKLTDKDHYYGDKDKAELTIIEYSDLECPFCQRFHPTVTQVVDEYKGKVNWVYRHFPLSFHANAKKEAEASECAAKLGGDKKFYEYIDAIFERSTVGGTGFALDKLVPLAKELGLDEKKFKSCLDSGEMASRVDDDFKEGQRLGVDGTPGSILLRKDGATALVPGAVGPDELKAEIERLLAK